MSKKERKKRMLTWAQIILYIVVPAVICLIGVLLTITWPYLKDAIWGKHPDTYVYCYGMEHSYTIDQLKEKASIRSKITLTRIRYPDGVSSLPNNEVPVKFFNWTYSGNEKLFTIAVSNKGDGIARNIKVDIDFTPNSIVYVKINNEERVDLIQGGKPTGTRAIFKINELLPDEIQDIEILTIEKGIKNFNAWSETQGDIKNIFIFDVAIEPDR